MLTPLSNLAVPISVCCVLDRAFTLRYWIWAQVEVPLLRYTYFTKLLHLQITPKDNIITEVHMFLLVQDFLDYFLHATTF